MIDDFVSKWIATGHSPASIRLLECQPLSLTVEESAVLSPTKLWSSSSSLLERLRNECCGGLSLNRGGRDRLRIQLGRVWCGSHTSPSPHRQPEDASGDGDHDDVILEFVCLHSPDDGSERVG